MAERTPLPTWWSISGEELMKLLRRCHAGEDPDMVYMEQYVNADITPVEGIDE